MSSLALGTVQFGLNYGITNSAGELSDEAVVGILRAAMDAGVTLFDTAADYGSSQQRLGKFVPSDGARAYVTKFSLPSDGADPTPENLYGESMSELCVSHLHGLLFHKLSDLTDERCAQALQLLRSARTEGVITRIGVSIYNAEDLTLALEVFPDLDILQLPANVLDLRLLESDAVRELHERGVEIHVRSVFLQGLVLANPAGLPKYFQPLQPALQFLRDNALEQNMSVLAQALGAMRQHPFVDVVVVGATSLVEVEEIVHAWQSAGILEPLRVLGVPAAVLDPRNWPTVRVTS